MKWIEAKVIFESDVPQLAADLISDAFYDFGLQGVLVESPEVDTDDDWGDGAQKPPDFFAVSGYFPKNELIEKRCEVLASKLQRLETQNRIQYRIVFREMDEEDWSESWKAYFWPQKVGKDIVVKPTWRDYDPLPGEIVLEIDPGMAFGTGTHASTALCITLIETYLKKGDSFLDVGTGSGILLIAAAKLEADNVWGIDNDEVAVEIACRNLLYNEIDRKRFKVLTGNLTDEVEGSFKVVAANILSEVIVVLLDDVKRILANDGIFIASGIIEANKETVLEQMDRRGFEILEILTREKWVAIAAKLKK